MDIVSVIIPTYKRCEYLCRAIDSVLSQSFQNIEIIVVDDNGNGTNQQLKTENIMSKYSSNEKVKYIINKNNVGGALARNIGISASTGTFITFLDDDDIYLPEKIGIQVEGMKTNGWDLSLTDNKTCNEKGEIINTKIQNISENPEYKELLTAHLIDHLTVTNNFMFRSKSLKNIGGFDNYSSAQEYMLVLKAIEAKLKVGHIKRILVVNHMHEGERISTGPKKIKVQKELIKVKRKYFYLLNSKQKRLILCRHYSVLFFIFYKNKKYYNALLNSILAIIVSPIGTLNYLNNYKRKLSRN
ncbi:glycosyltransferase family 2 protein [Halobacillus campisalis]|uniref:Glycosyltransferase family 2 protein n=1 Tax=Halobacillus campisalis TaxID=435909 RepID=A0ABW2JY41_9BACI|nr:glycosyltransferase [Halobacillus campisalis]